MLRLRKHSLLILIFVVGLALRAYHLERTPHFNETSDEFAWTWSGMSLLQTGTPTAWTFLPAYGNVPWTPWSGYQFHMVKPWLDHPPLFSLLMGAWMRLGGYQDIFRVDLYYMRLSSLLFFCANFWLTFVLLGKYFERAVVTLALGLFAVAPIVVLDHRLVISEHFLLMVYTLVHLAMLRWEATGQKRWIGAVAVGAACLPLTKLAAVSISLYLGVLALLRRNGALLAAVVLGTAAGFGLYWLYGAHFDSKLFWAVLKAHRARFSGFNGFFEFMFVHKIVDTRFFYAPFLVGAGVALFNLAELRAREYYLQFVAYSGCMTIFVDQYNVYGWYLIPMYPVLCAGAAQLAVRMIRDQPPLQWTWAMFSLAYVGAMMLSWWPEKLTALRHAYLALFVAVPLVLWLGRRVRWAWPALGVSLVALQLGVDLKYVLSR
jgi:hypothetical protein